ncbi:MAG: hypothetical protein HWD61_00215 [Parachlamydiaceae bacterium]|nr:MAG: hypothetical protein HWD61_00215 [Parachlamydiaceae bacterium]
MLTRVDPETYAKDAHLSRNTQDANWVVKALDTLVQVLKDKDKKDQEIQFKENNQVIVTEPDLKES